MSLHEKDKLSKKKRKKGANGTIKQKERTLYSTKQLEKSYFSPLNEKEQNIP